MPRDYKKKVSKKPRRSAAPRRPRRGIVRNIRNVPEYAALSVKRSFQVPGGNPVANQMYNIMAIQLDAFDRAVSVARAYQHYRMKYVKVTFFPPYDTYQNAGGGWMKPYLYYMIDKSGAIPTNVTLEALKQMGARPKAFDEKPLTVGWRPSVLTVDMTQGGGAFVGGQAAQYKISPWLSTSNTAVAQPWNPSAVDHLGLYFFVAASQTGAPPAPFIYTFEVEVQFEFKKPLIDVSAGSPDAIGVTLSKLDLSPDGVEGGVDGITVPIVQGL